MEQGMFQLVVLAYSRQLIEGLGADDCPAASWIFLSEQGDEIEAVETHFKKTRFFRVFFKT